ncbi:ribokinase [Actinomyces sp. B33]|uniref:ribokinase n=1 Tax=Actinomyces sp. B33 TaxID=2942131 RepID=UPI0023402C81|nr:ribokinase [Actinomyces sp. B33]MDC4233745.1 ribokinase [Actinomyces sp. B33]
MTTQNTPGIHSGPARPAREGDRRDAPAADPADRHRPLDLLDRIGDGSVVVVGSLNADLTVRTARFPDPGETVSGEDLQVLPGGKSANQAVQAARLGADVTMIGTVGDDANGDLLVESLRAAGARTELVGRAPVATGTAVITVDDEGENTIIVSPGANARTGLGLVERHAERIASASALGLCLEIDLDAVARAAAIAHEAGTIVVLNNSPFRADLPADLLGIVDVLVVNEHELEGMLVHHGLADAGSVDPGACEQEWAGCARSLAGLGIERAVVTLGARGSVVLDRGRVAPIDPAPAEVVDTTGAGDSFLGTLLASLAAGGSLVEAATLASAVSAHSTRALGAQASYGDRAALRALWPPHS